MYPARPLTRRQTLLGAIAAGALASPWLHHPALAWQDDALPRPAGPTAPDGAPRDGGTLVCGTPREPDSLHPWLATSAAAFDLLDGVMDGLLRYTAEGKLRPALAETFSISDDGLTYTFT
jgi:ABC-type transport system substrate-binding protein